MTDQAVMAELDRLLGPLDGGRVAGGCRWCWAVTSVRKLAYGRYALVVYHDRGCPRLARYEKEGKER